MLQPSADLEIVPLLSAQQVRRTVVWLENLSKAQNETFGESAGGCHVFGVQLTPIVAIPFVGFAYHQTFFF
jgi:hypothetical protein